MLNSSSDMEPKISIILPVHNGERYMASAVESVLSQTRKDWELLAIDDGSTDGSGAIIKRFADKEPRIKYLRNEKNLGIQKTLNKGLQEAQGEYIARIDDDDLWIAKDKLERQADFLDQHKGHVIVGTGTVVVDGSGQELFKYLNPISDVEVRRKILFKNCFTHSSVLMRKEAVLGVGGYDESEGTLHVEDYDLWLRLGGVGKMANLPFYMTEFRLRRGAISGLNKKDQLKKDVRLVKKYGKDYPGGSLAILAARLRVAAYYVYAVLPFKALALRLYKKY